MIMKGDAGKYHMFMIFIISILSQVALAQEIYTENGYVFTVDVKNNVTGVKDQALSSTCWSFSTLAMLESEMLSQGKGEYDLSEMFIVYYTYIEKAIKYIRMHGKISFTGGGALNDVTDIMKKYGIMPDAAYPGKLYEFQLHNHEKMDIELKEYMDRLIITEGFNSGKWLDSLQYIMEKYMGKMPEKFIHEDKEYSAPEFFNELEIKPDDYILFTSYAHHPFYERFVLEVPDNWSWGEAFNLQIGEITRVIDYALKNEYTVAWAADVSEDYFSWEHGIAVVPDTVITGKEDIFLQPVNEIKITQELRQLGYDTYETTDDHGMQIIGLAYDQNGKEYYLVKNSWGTIGNCFNGYLFVSKAYLKYKTMTFFLKKEAIPSDIRSKLGI